MRRGISTYLFVSQRISPALLSEIEAAFEDAAKRAGQPLGEACVEIFCRRSHFDYHSPEAIRELQDWFRDHPLRLHALHAPTSRDVSASRESAAPISISEPERVRRLDAVEEVKRALEVAEQIPYRFLVLHLGGREPMDARRMSAAFNSLEHLVIFAKQRGVVIALENTPGELATPANLRHFIEETKLRDLRLCFDIGHAHMGDGVPLSFETMRELVVTSHLHDNHRDRDEHLLPWDGDIDWDAAMRALAHAPAADGPLPLILELKEPPPGTPETASALLRRAMGTFERLNRGIQAWAGLRKT